MSGDNESLIEFVEKSTTDQQVSNYNDVNSFLMRILRKFGMGEYEQARKIFYSSLGGFSRFFDDLFIVHCAGNELRAVSKIKKRRPHHIVNHSKFCADLIAFSKLIFRQNKKSFNYFEKMEYGTSYFEILGYSRLVDFKAIYLSHASDLSRLSIEKSSQELLDYMYHIICLFGGIWRRETLEEIEKIYSSDTPAEPKFYKVQKELALCMSDFGVFRPPQFVEIVLPKTEDVPRTKEDAMRYSLRKGKKKTYTPENNEIAESPTTEENLDEISDEVYESEKPYYFDDDDEIEEEGM